MAGSSSRPPLWPILTGVLLLAVGFAAAWIHTRHAHRPPPPPASIESAAAGATATLSGRPNRATAAYGEAADGYAEAGWGELAQSLRDTAAFLQELDGVGAGGHPPLAGGLEGRPLYAKREPGVFRALLEHDGGLILLVAVDCLSDLDTEPRVTACNGAHFVAWTRTAPGGTWHLFALLRDRPSAEVAVEAYEEAPTWPRPDALVETINARAAPELEFRSPANSGGDGG